MKRMLTGGNVLIMHFSYFHHLMKIVVAMVTEIVKILQKHMDPAITKNCSR